MSRVCCSHRCPFWASLDRFHRFRLLLSPFTRKTRLFVQLTYEPPKWLVSLWIPMQPTLCWTLTRDRPAWPPFWFNFPRPTLYPRHTVAGRNPFRTTLKLQEAVVCCWYLQGNRIIPVFLRREIIGVIFGCFARKIDGFPWFPWWFNHLPGPLSSHRFSFLWPINPSEATERNGR